MRKVIGLTGGIASGKSLVVNMFKDEGYEIIDCDKLVKNLYEDKSFIKSIEDKFGSEYILPTRQVNKITLGKAIFGDTKKRLKINELVHPIIIRKIDAILSKSDNEKIIIDMPLLYEAEYNDCDVVICIYCEYNKRVERLIRRDQINKEYAVQKISSQMDLDKKKFLSDYCIDNSNNIIDTKNQFNEIIKKL